MTYGLKIFNQNSTTILDSRFKNYRLLHHSVSSLPFTTTIESEAIPLVFVAAPEGVCVLPAEISFSSGFWNITVDVWDYSTIGWDLISIGSISPVKWNSSISQSSAFNAPLVYIGTIVADIFIFGVKTSTSAYGIAFLDGANSFRLTDDPLVVVQSCYLDPGAMFIDDDNSIDYGPGDTGSYVDWTLTSTNSNYGKLVSLSGGITNPAICVGSFDGGIRGQNIFSQIANTTYRFGNGTFILGIPPAVTIMDGILTSYTGNFHRVEVRKAFDAFINVLVIDQDMYK